MNDRRRSAAVPGHTFGDAESLSLGAPAVREALTRAQDAVRAIDRLGGGPADLSRQDLAALASQLVTLSKRIDLLLDTLVLSMRARGASWNDLGDALDVHRSTARSRYERVTGSRLIRVGTEEQIDLRDNPPPVLSDE